MNKTLASDGVQADWDFVSGAWAEEADYVEASVAPVTTRALELLAARPGESILELGAGAGTFGALLADAVAPGGRVVVSDLAPGMVAAAERRLRERGIAGVETKMIDGQAIDLPAGSVDAVVARMVYMLMSDPALAFAEARRILRPEGRLVFSVWGAPQDNIWALSLGMAMMQSGFDAPDPFAPGGLFSLGDPQIIHRLLSDAGFENIQIEEVVSPHEFVDFESYWRSISRLAGPIAVLLAGLQNEKVQQVREALRTAVSHHETPEGLVLPGAALVVRAS